MRYVIIFSRMKMLFCIWWDLKDTAYQNLFPHDLMLNSNESCPQLQRLKTLIDQKHLDWVQYFISTTTALSLSWNIRQKLIELSYNDMLRTPLDYHLFRSIIYIRSGRTYILQKTGAITSPSSSSRNIPMKLPERWRKCRG